MRLFLSLKAEKKLIVMTLGRTNLRIGASGAKFDAEDDFEVRLALASPKPGKIDQKQNFRSKKNRRFFFFDVEKSNVRNRLKRVFSKFGGPTGHVQGINSHSKFQQKNEICELLVSERIFPDN